MMNVIENAKTSNDFNKDELVAVLEAAGYRKCKTSLSRGYISRKITGYFDDYKGRYGEGYVLREPNWESTQYSCITYFVK